MQSFNQISTNSKNPLTLENPDVCKKTDWAWISRFQEPFQQPKGNNMGFKNIKRNLMNKKFKAFKSLILIKKNVGGKTYTRRKQKAT